MSAYTWHKECYRPLNIPQWNLAADFAIRICRIHSKALDKSDNTGYEPPPDIRGLGDFEVVYFAGAELF